MIQETQDSQIHLQQDQWRARISAYLQQRAAVGVVEVAEQLGVDESVVRHCLDQFEQKGQVEVLRPVGCQPGARPDLDYYRWRQVGDNYFCLQRELHRQRSMTLHELR